MSPADAFELVTEKTVPEVGSKASLYRHRRTGAEVLSLVNDDENKVFGIAFRTPPADSTGLPHILEHSVLGGSRKYPVKEPFVELLKGSLHTFVNAMTYPDKTNYPVASTNERDFHNLMDVYLDAVLNPRIDRQTFSQEGWHYELDGPDAPLSFKGVVFNEMKGYYSSPDYLIAGASQRSVYPGNPYGHDAGGDPAAIPDLTFEQFRDFHSRYYHPSNARIFFYGDDDPAERLAHLERFLGAFDRAPVDSEITLQPRLNEPRHIRSTYPAATDQPPKSFATINWMIETPADAEQRLALDLLERAIVGTPASPLRKALIDSRLGEGIAGYGLQLDFRQPLFSIGLKGMAPENAGKVEPLVLDTLARLAREGLAASTVEAAFNTLEFRLRENNTGGKPRGLQVMEQALETWLHGGNPFDLLEFDAPLKSLKARLDSGERVLENLIRTEFLDNPHRATVILDADSQHNDRRNATETDRLGKIRAGMSTADLDTVVREAEELVRRQELPDTPEALARIPSLTLADLPRSVQLIPLHVGSVAGTTVLSHDLPTRQIVYVDAAFDLTGLRAELLPYMGIFGRALLETGAGDDDFVTLSERIGRTTGGVSQGMWTSPRIGRSGPVSRLMLRAKALPSQTGGMFDILRKVLLEARIFDRERIRQIVRERKAQAEAAVARGGHGFLAHRIRSQYRIADAADEAMTGITFVRFIRGLADNFDERWPEIEKAFTEIRETLIARNGLVLNVTADADGIGRVERELSGFVAALPAGTTRTSDWAVRVASGAEGFSAPLQVGFVGKGADLFKLGFQPNGAASVVTRHLARTWLWETVRVKGGAYGGTAQLDRFSGVLTYLSWSDPNVTGTLDNYDASANFLRTVDLSDQELTRAIIGMISDLDLYRLPDAKGLTSMQRWLMGMTDEIRQANRDEVLGTTLADFRAFADVLDAVAAQGNVAVIASEAALKAANAERQGLLTVAPIF
ncbi:MAG: insulinase family protein [Bauldia sp.]